MFQFLCFGSNFPVMHTWHWPVLVSILSVLSMPNLFGGAGLVISQTPWPYLRTSAMSFTGIFSKLLSLFLCWKQGQWWSHSDYHLRVRTSFSYWWRWLRQTAPGKLGPPCSQFYSTDEFLSQVPSCDHQISVVRVSDRGLEREAFHVILNMLR